MQEYSKKIKKLIREFAAEAHERELHRELFKRYNGDLLDMMVAYAIAAGILKREEIPAELLEALTGPLEYFDRLRDRGELKIPKE